jgi:hypothetical protein
VKPGDQRQVLEEAFALLLALGADAGSRPADVLKLGSARTYIRTQPLFLTLSIAGADCRSDVSLPTLRPERRKAEPVSPCNPMR